MYMICYIMSSTSIRLTIGDDFQKILEKFKRDYPLLEYPEIIRMAVSGYYRIQEDEEIQKTLVAFPVSEELDEVTEKNIKKSEDDYRSGDVLRVHPGDQKSLLEALER